MDDTDAFAFNYIYEDDVTVPINEQYMLWETPNIAAVDDRCVARSSYKHIHFDTPHHNDTNFHFQNRPCDEKKKFLCEGVNIPCPIQNKFAELCHVDADCVRTDAADMDYHCSCRSELAGDGISNCDAVNVCNPIMSCSDPNHICSITWDGSVECSCKTGYMSDGYGNCVDIDECSATRPSVITPTCSRYGTWEEAVNFCKDWNNQQVFTPNTDAKMATLIKYLSDNTITEDVWIGVRSYMKHVDGFAQSSFETEFHQSFRFLERDGTVNYFGDSVNDTAQWVVGNPIGLSTKDGVKGRYGDVCASLQTSSGLIYNDACRRRKRFVCEMLGTWVIECTQGTEGSVDVSGDLGDSGICSGPKLCSNLDGSYECICPAGSTELDGACIQNNPCDDAITNPCNAITETCYFLNIPLLTQNYWCVSNDNPCATNPCSHLENTECIGLITEYFIHLYSSH